ncbi:MAG: hemerythrin domain-containing protein [Candidatus Paceibacterota bacterium]
MEKISKHMEDHHKIIDALFEGFENEVGGEREKVVEVFERFKWELQKHIFLEEKAIFSFCQKCYIGEDKVTDIAADMVKTHDEILEKLNDLENELILEDDFDVSELKDLLLKHEKEEDSKLYPVLDERLDSLHKKIVIKKVKEFPIKGPKH